LWGSGLQRGRGRSGVATCPAKLLINYAKFSGANSPSGAELQLLRYSRFIRLTLTDGRGETTALWSH